MWCLRCRLCCIKITISSHPDKMKGNISFPSGDRTISDFNFIHIGWCNEFRKAIFLSL